MSWTAGVPYLVAQAAQLFDTVYRTSYNVSGHLLDSAVHTVGQAVEQFGQDAVEHIARFASSTADEVLALGVGN